MGDLVVGFLFVRRSRYDALCRDLQAWQRKEAEASRELKAAEEAVEAAKEESRRKGKAAADYAQKLLDARTTISVLRSQLKEISVSSHEIGDKANGLALKASPASESVLEGA